MSRKILNRWFCLYKTMLGVVLMLGYTFDICCSIDCYGININSITDSSHGTTPDTDGTAHIAFECYKRKDTAISWRKAQLNAEKRLIQNWNHWRRSRSWDFFFLVKQWFQRNLTFIPGESVYTDECFVIVYSIIPHFNWFGI